jgi:hypothetical protein
VKAIGNILFTTTFAVSLFVLAGCKTSSSSKTAAIELFNGKNFNGWTFCMRDNADPMQTWSVSDGVMHCTGQPYGYARTKKSFHDYRLTCIWRFVRVAPHADNSGIFIHIQPADVVWPECIECQGWYQHQGDIMLHAGVGADGYPAQKKTINVPQMGPSNENPVGEWNTNQIICEGNTLGLSVNGRVMNTITGCNLSSGYIGIQSEGGDIEIRELTLERLE